MAPSALAAADLPIRLILEALAVNLAVGGLAFFLRTVSATGCAAGVGVGTAIYAAVGRPGFALLVLFFAAGSAATKLGLRRKALLGAAQAEGGARSARHVLGKGLVPAACAILAWALDRPAWALVAFTAALAAALADTVATELGTLIGRRHWTIVPLSRVAAGSAGAVSLEGTLLGAASAAVVGGAAAAVGLAPGMAVWVVALAAVVAGLRESVEGRLLAGVLPERLRGPLLNVDLTLMAAAIGGLLWWATN